MNKDFISNAAAILFAIGAVLALVGLISRTEPVLLTVAVLIACVGGIVLALA